MFRLHIFNLLLLLLLLLLMLVGVVESRPMAEIRKTRKSNFLMALLHDHDENIPCNISL